MKNKMLFDKDSKQSYVIKCDMLLLYLVLGKFKFNNSVQFKRDVVQWQKTHKSPSRTAKC